MRNIGASPYVLRISTNALGADTAADVATDILPNLLASGHGEPCAIPPTGTSAADLKFLHHLQQARFGTSNRKAAL